jgi:hypothetical protein
MTQQSITAVYNFKPSKITKAQRDSKPSAMDRVWQRVVMKPEDVPLLRRVRRRMIAAGNQHQISYYQYFTQILYTMVWKPT